MSTRPFKPELRQTTAHSTRRSHGWFSHAGRRVVSLLSVIAVTVGITAIGALTSTTPASADHAGLQGYYSSGNGIDGFCIDPGKALPTGRTFITGNKFGNDASKVLSWFATHYGPSGSSDSGGAPYIAATADPRLGGLPTNSNAGDVTIATGRAIVKAEGGSPIHGVDDAFTNALLAFAQTYPGPWQLQIALNFQGPYTVGTTYNGHLQIGDRDGQAVPVGGINVSVTGQTGVTVSIPGSNETDNNGRLDFTFSPTANGTFDARFETTDIAGRAPVAEDSVNQPGYQRLLIPSRHSDDAILFGATPTVLTGAFVVGKVNETGTVGLPGATFWITTSEPDVADRTLVDVIVTADGSGNLPRGVAVSNVPLPPGDYIIIEVGAPAGYFLPTDFSFDPSDPFRGRQFKPIQAGVFTNVLFADRPMPGEVTIGKFDANTTQVTALAGAVFRIDRCRTLVASECGQNGGADTLTTGPTPANGIINIPGVEVGFYLITEIQAPPGYALNTDPQIQQVYPAANTNALFVDKRQPTVSTQISDQSTGVGRTITDDITVTNTGPGPYASNVIWVLYGPLPPLPGGPTGFTCTGVVWAVPGSPVAATGSVPVTGDGTYTTAGYTIPAGGQGCYTYTEFLVATPAVASAGPSQPGAATETTLAYTFSPEVTTQASSQTARIGDVITDAITVTGSGTYVGPVNWTLLGPVPAIASPTGDTCVGVDWSGAPTAATGTVIVAGDGTYTTAGYTVAALGCYTYTELLVGNATTAPAGPSTPGAVTETVVVPRPQPSVSTQISDQDAFVGATITDDITVTGSEGYQGPVNWTLYGPVAALAGGPSGPTCVGVDWTNAPVAATGSVTVDGDGTYTTAGYVVAVVGCYTYTELLVGNATTAPAGPSTPGAVTETVVVTLPQPTVSTQISDQDAGLGDTITDSITVAGSDGYQGPVNWTLLGPVAPLPDSSGFATCVGVDWTGAPVAATGSVTVDGDGTYTTAGYVVTVVGCYTYTELLVGDSTTLPAGPSVPGAVSETVLVYPFAPEVSTQISKQRALVGDTITDNINVTGSGGYVGPVNWTLLGPVAPRGSGSTLTCTGINWTAAPTAATGTVAVNGDGTYTTVGYKVLVAGCYTYIELLVGDDETAPAGPSTPGKISETVLVTKRGPGVIGRPSTPFLPTTGSELAILALAGLALVTVGGAMAAATRRRRRLIA